MKGTYIIVLYLSKDLIIKVGALGKILFAKGYYLYVGSAMGNINSSSLLNRVNRHLSNSKDKKIHWHIDYLMNNKYIFINTIYLIPSSLRLECILAREINSISDGNIQDFGSSDCKCKSHLLYFKVYKGLINELRLNKG
jgi:Uri superfamily endonuclease